MPEPKDKSLESWIWDAACSIRGAKDAPKYKDYILPLIFTKRLCDVFDDELDRIAAEVGTRRKAFQLVKADPKLVRFYLPLAPDDPDQPIWSIVRKLSNQIGEQLTTHLRAIARENPLLQGIIDRVDFNATTHGQRDLDDDRLSNLIEAVSTKRLGLEDVEPDIIGKSYEYLIRKFAEGGGQSAGEFLYSSRGRRSHGTCDGCGTRHGSVRPMLRFRRATDQVRTCDGKNGAGAFQPPEEGGERGQECPRPVETLRPGIHPRNLGNGQHEHHHPRHGG